MTASFFDGYVLYENIAPGFWPLAYHRIARQSFPGRWTNVFWIRPWRVEHRFRQDAAPDRQAGPLPTFCRMEKITLPFMAAMTEVICAGFPMPAYCLPGPTTSPCRCVFRISGVIGSRLFARAG